MDYAPGSELLALCQTCKYFQKAIKIPKYRDKFVSNFMLAYQMVAFGPLFTQLWMEDMIIYACQVYITGYNAARHSDAYCLMRRISFGLNRSNVLLDFFRAKPCHLAGFIILLYLKNNLLTPFRQNTSENDGWNEPLVFVDPVLSAEMLDIGFENIICHNMTLMLSTHPIFKHVIIGELMSKFVIPA